MFCNIKVGGILEVYDDINLILHEYGILYTSDVQQYYKVQVHDKTCVYKVKDSSIFHGINL